MKARGWAMVSCGVALASLVPVVLKQLGAVPHLPDPPGAWWDSDAVTESKAAHPLGVPDGLLGLASYGVTLGLLAGADRNERVRRVARAKLCADAALAVINVARQPVQFGRGCSWCMATALATAGVVGFGWRGTAAP